jgi:hypothetical protein
MRKANSQKVFYGGFSNVTLFTAPKTDFKHDKGVHVKQFANPMCINDQPVPFQNDFLLLNCSADFKLAYPTPIFPHDL